MGTLDNVTEYPIIREMATLDGSNNITVESQFTDTISFFSTRTRSTQTFTYKEVFDTLTEFN